MARSKLRKVKYTVRVYRGQKKAPKRCKIVTRKVIQCPKRRKASRLGPANPADGISSFMSRVF